MIIINGIFTWYTFAKEIFAEFEIDKSDFEAFSRPFKIAKTLLKKYLKNLFMNNMKNN
jgi:dTDP-4-dehydrorhamnose reductase